MNALLASNIVNLVAESLVFAMPKTLITGLRVRLLRRMASAHRLSAVAICDQLIDLNDETAAAARLQSECHRS
jgi:hypothetical protein